MNDSSTVLFVDDEPVLADGYAAKLREYDTRTAYDGRAALDQLDESVDVVFLDRKMPGMSGKEVLEEIRESGHDCRVVMLTGVEPDIDVVEMGFDEYLLKPVDAAELRETVERLAAKPTDTFDDPIFEALGDPKAMRCCAALLNGSRSAQELATILDCSLATVYRRLNTLRQAGLVTSRNTVDPDGDHYQTFTVVPTRISIDINEEVQVSIEQTNTDE